VIAPLILVGVCFALIVWQALRKPMLRRLAVRDVVRRRGETALVIAGSLLGTALITGSLIVGDTLDSSIRAAVTNQLGPVDEVVTVSDPRQGATLLSEIGALDDPRIDGVTSVLTARGAFVSNAGGDRLAEPKAQLLELDFETARDFGDDPTITGISGPTPLPGEVVFGEDLAERLEVAEGDEVTGFVYGSKIDLEVARILPRTGLAGFWLGFESTSTNAFVAPGTLQDAVGGRPPRGAAPPEFHVLVSNRGGVEEGGALSHAVRSLIEETVGTSGLRVEEVKREGLDEADAQGNEFGELFLGIGSFAIVAGILLLVNIFVMLAEERKNQLGMLRAVGMKRSHLIRAFVIQGGIYALGAGILGAFLGIGVGWAIAKLAAPIFGGFDDFSLELTFAIDPQSLVVGFCSGVLISLLTIFGTSVRISRINIIRAIRDLPEPNLYAARRRTIIIGSVLALLALASFIASLGEPALWVPAILGLPVAAFCLLPLLSRMVGRRAAVTGVATFALAWGVFGDMILGGDFFENGDIFAFVIQGVLLTFSAVILLSQTQENIEGGIRKVAAARLPLRLSIAYPLARRGRTGLTLGMFSLVIFTMTFIAVLSNVFGGQVETAIAKEGGFDILATSSPTDPPSTYELQQRRGVGTVATLKFGTALFQPSDLAEPEPWSASGIDDTFVSGGPPRLSERLEGLSPDEVWDRLLIDPRAIVVPEFFLQEGGGPPQSVIDVGEKISVIHPLTGERVERRVIGKVENDFAFSGVYMSNDSLTAALGQQATPSRFYIKVEEGAEQIDVARRLQGAFVANGLEADPFRTIVEDFQRSNLQFFQLMQSYLALGLLVGIAGLGVVMVRAVRERRREIGVLRSLGFLPRMVRSAFVLESGFVALEGILVGVLLALVTSAQLVATGEFGEDIAFIIPWGQIVILTAAALAASLLATAWPARQASRIPPAVALRIAE
jgi:putative ABC transport system permease protein